MVTVSCLVGPTQSSVYAALRCLADSDLALLDSDSSHVSDSDVQSQSGVLVPSSYSFDQVRLVLEFSSGHFSLLYNLGKLFMEVNINYCVPVVSY